jgi:adenosylcobinamide kinase / adenosylcobinamide-phosphate guanylyltransferase
VVWRRVLVLGGARSGKSGFAERLAESLASPVLYVATATASDAEMSDRIAQHRARRPAAWHALESPLSLRVSLGGARTLLVEDLTLLLNNLMRESLADAESRAVAEVEAVLQADAHVILVSNEVGMGLVPDTAVGRNFRDALGRLNQHAAGLVHEAYFLVAGLSLRVK